MVDIQKLASLTGIQLSSTQQSKLELQIQSVISLLEQVKEYDLPEPHVSWHEIVGVTTVPQKEQVADATPDAIINNIDHAMI